MPCNASNIAQEAALCFEEPEQIESPAHAFKTKANSSRKEMTCERTILVSHVTVISFHDWDE